MTDAPADRVRARGADRAAAPHDVAAVTSGTRLLVTAHEAFPALESLFLDAQDRIAAGFRIFDPDTTLLSDRARAVGRTWFDLILHTLRRGVRLDLMISDFDPIVQPEYHRETWRSLRRVWAAVELAGPGVRFALAHGLHPARIAYVPRMILWRRARAELVETRDRLNAMPLGPRLAHLRDMPGLHDRLHVGPDGRIVLVPGGPPILYTTTHHHKVAIADGLRLYIGGLDLNDRRYDTPAHERPSDQTWHDVQIVTDGPVAAAAERHLLNLPSLINGAARPVDTQPSGLLTTVSAVRKVPLPALAPRVVRNDLLRRHEGLIERAESCIYLETQFFRDRGLARTLAIAARDRPGLTLLMILPAAPEVVAFEGRTKADARFGEYLQGLCIRRVRRAFGRRAFFATPALRSATGDTGRQATWGAPIIYVHAKLSIFDDSDMIVSSANLNGRSLHWDSEAGIHIADRPFVTAARHRALAHWLPPTAAADAVDPRRMLDVVRDTAMSDAHRPPAQRRGLLLPYDLRPAVRFGRPLPGVPDEMV